MASLQQILHQTEKVFSLTDVRSSDLHNAMENGIAGLTSITSFNCDTNTGENLIHSLPF